MEGESLLEFSQRDEAFWAGLALLLCGTLIPETIRVAPVEVAGATVGPIGLGGVLLGAGALVLAVRVLVGVGSILRTAIRAWRAGRTRGRLDD